MLSTLIAILILIILAILLIVLLTFATYQASRQRIGYIPLPMRAVPAVIKALDLKGTGRLIDLGCGDGRILQAACIANSKIQAEGIEINPIVVWMARWRLRAFHKTTIKFSDINKTSLHSARWIFTYLSHSQMAELESKFMAELPKGCRLVSCDFPLPHQKPTRTIRIGEPWQLGQNLYVYDY